ncbi:TRAP transporter small permease [Consotaella salsifontis]|uniref:TRAP transporter small permease protein n=1 Tax=Consotaella salsifontis TaxID=1365950 RepID=A0A1T4T2C2_9HYPH|nr:TRAP transporter small permease [Consotaella salsifontis]SKA34654.1 TRAP-type C4-dicarboxylate transport system, small permease component [Consotaella salsifontis]
MFRKLIIGLDWFNTIATKAAGWLATVLLMVMTTVVTIHVICRYGFGYSFVWTEEVARYLMVWMTFLFFPLGHKRGMNVAVDFLVVAFRNTKAGIALRLVLEIMVVVLAVFCVKISLGMIGRGMSTMTQALQVPVGLIYLVLPLSFGLTFLCAVEKVLELSARLAGQRVVAIDEETISTEDHGTDDEDGATLPAVAVGRSE